MPPRRIISGPPTQEGPSPRSPRRLIGSALLGLAILVIAACGGGGNEDPLADERSTPTEQLVASEVGSEDETTASSVVSGPLSAEEIASQIEPLPSALDIPWREGPAPVTISFPSIGVDGSPIDAVGVEPNGEMEVPLPRRVGWYAYGSSPGEEGSAVLAAHIAASGIDGVFRYLSDAEVGDQFQVNFDDGTVSTYEIIEMAQYNKQDLPFDRVFSREGEPIVTLITCGGTFQPSVSSYEDNVVAYAVPIDG